MNVVVGQQKEQSFQQKKTCFESKSSLIFQRPWSKVLSLSHVRSFQSLMTAIFCLHLVPVRSSLARVMCIRITKPVIPILCIILLYFS